MAEEARELTLYVQSKKTVTTFYRAHPAGGAPSGTSIALGPASVTNAPRDDLQTDARSDDAVYFLSDDQSRCVALTEDLARHRGYRIRVVDIARVGRLERLVTEHLRGVQNFPVLISPDGRRLEGVPQFTDDHVAALMPTELKRVRAFTYIKVHGGDLDRIRRLLVALPEVMELHFLTGDWDILVVLEFPPASANKRQVLDFVTERIRGIPEVLDTSTVVPEFTVTKFATPH